MRAGSFTSGLTHLVEKMRYTLYGKHRRTTFDASSSAQPPLRLPCAPSLTLPAVSTMSRCWRAAALR
jgi:hypothetical protein